MVPGKCPPLVEPPHGEGEGTGAPKGAWGRGLETEPEAGQFHSPGTFGLLLNLWGHSLGQQEQPYRESRTFGVVRKTLPASYVLKLIH